MTTEIVLSNPATIKAYFEKVRQLAKDGVQYPIDLNEVWPLVYAQKVKAVQILKKEYFETEDYEVISQKGKNPTGGRPEVDYRLTLSCMEHLIARKVREVFEVYRQVFHKAADAIEQTRPPLPMTPMELFVQQMQQLVVMGQQMVETQRDLAEVKSEIREIKEIQQAATTELLALPAPTEEMPEMSVENKIIRMVNLYAQAKSVMQVEVWRTLYTELLYRYRISVNAYKRQAGESKLQLLKRLGHLEKLFIIATNILKIEQDLVHN